MAAYLVLWSDGGSDLTYADPTTVATMMAMTRAVMITPAAQRVRVSIWLMVLVSARCLCR